jgi:hypothetical protein
MVPVLMEPHQRQKIPLVLREPTTKKTAYLRVLKEPATKKTNYLKVLKEPATKKTNYLRIPKEPATKKTSHHRVFKEPATKKTTYLRVPYSRNQRQKDHLPQGTQGTSGQSPDDLESAAA